MEVIFFVGGLIIGIMTTLVITRKHPIGTLRADYSEPDCPYLFLEIDQGQQYLLGKERLVSLRVDLSQK